jgi:hypothetical protein
MLKKKKKEKINFEEKWTKKWQSVTRLELLYEEDPQKKEIVSSMRFKCLIPTEEFRYILVEINGKEDWILYDTSQDDYIFIYKESKISYSINRYIKEKLQLLSLEEMTNDVLNKKINVPLKAIIKLTLKLVKMRFIGK